MFTIHYYCPCEECSGEWGYSIKSPCGEHKALSMHTIAVDESIIPLLSKVRISGYSEVTFVAEDVGGMVKGNVIDIFVETHEETLNQQIQQAEVFIQEKE